MKLQVDDLPSLYSEPVYERQPVEWRHEDGELPEFWANDREEAEQEWTSLRGISNEARLRQGAIAKWVSDHRAYGENDLATFASRVGASYATARHRKTVYEKLASLEIDNQLSILAALRSGRISWSHVLVCVGIESDSSLAAVLKRASDGWPLRLTNKDNYHYPPDRPLSKEDILPSVRRILEHQKKKASEKTRESLEAVPSTYSVIYADPPWKHGFSEEAMEVEEIEELGWSIPTAEDSVLFLWATSPRLREALRVMEYWGFEYVSSMVWIMASEITGHYTRQQHELLLIGKKGELPVPRPENRPPSVIDALSTDHSRKPEVVYELIEKMYPRQSKLELFARNRREGWEPWPQEG